MLPQTILKEATEMDFEQALELRDRFVPMAREVAVQRRLRTATVENGNVVVPDPVVSRPVALGVSVREDGSFGLAVRTVGSPIRLTGDMLPEMIEAARGEVDLLGIEPVSTRTQELRSRTRPLFPGVSLGHPAITAGTLGTVVIDRSDGSPAILSNNHVLANSNQAAIGDPCIQPGPIDGGTEGDVVGALSRFVEVRDGVEVDAAIARLEEQYVRPLTIGSTLGLTGRIATARRAIDVAKIGRTTGFTQGRISAVALIDLEISFGDRLVSFDDQIEIRSPAASPFSAGGDSGSLVVDLQGNAVGLLFAGTTSRDRQLDITYVNPIARVLDLLEVDLIL
jgi:hypothetical protein